MKGDKIMKILKYKGIVFDDWAEDQEEGKIVGYWAEICQECVEKYKDLISDDIDDGGTARGCCSIKGCSNTGEDEDRMHYYIDFKIEFVTFEEVGEDDDYDEQYI